ncbi:hypothetical protein Nepgr_025150 [Nepenthes gracilis]|uniref:Uncharacterized protein n=1 Tax=Nepenthes gracilis TaxID=150966 RepID=A0AAD3XZ97_NEPGR|nr:hypothetical protein Nepgr_025150 [Nepenthes gracilis]
MGVLAMAVMAPPAPWQSVVVIAKAGLWEMEMAMAEYWLDFGPEILLKRPWTVPGLGFPAPCSIWPPPAVSKLPLSPFYRVLASLWLRKISSAVLSACQ